MVSLSKHVRTHFCGPSLRHVRTSQRAGPERSRRYTGRWFNRRLQPSSPQLALSVIMVSFAFLFIGTCWVLTGPTYKHSKQLNKHQNNYIVFFNCRHIM